MITVNTTSTSLIDLEKLIYVAKCPQCCEQFSVYTYPKHICPYCYTSIPDILGIINTTVIKQRYYFSKDLKIRLGAR